MRTRFLDVVPSGPNPRGPAAPRRRAGALAASLALAVACLAPSVAALAQVGPPEHVPVGDPPPCPLGCLRPLDVSCDIEATPDGQLALAIANDGCHFVRVQGLVHGTTRVCFFDRDLGFIVCRDLPCFEEVDLELLPQAGRTILPGCGQFSFDGTATSCRGDVQVVACSP